MVRIKIRVMAVVAIAGPPAVVDVKLRQIGEPSANQRCVNSGRGAAHQGAKRIEICRSRSLGNQVRVQKRVVSNLIISVVVDVLRHVFVQYSESGSVGWIAGSTRNLRVRDAAEFVVLDPKVGLEYLQRRWKPKQSCVSP